MTDAIAAFALRFDGPAPSREDVAAHLRERLGALPALRRRPVADPLGLGPPRWVDDPDLDVQRHLRLLPAGAGGEAGLRELAARFLAEPPAPGLPPWKLWMVADPGGAGFAALWRAQGDAAGDDGGVAALSALFGPAPAAARADAAPHPPRRPSAPELLAQAAWERATIPLRVVGPALHAVRRPDRALARVLASGERALAGAAALLWPRPPTPYGEADEPGELRLSWARIDVAELAPLLDSPGASLDGVLASAVTRALRRDLERRGFEGDSRAADRVAGLVVDAAAEVSGELRLAGRPAREVLPLPATSEGLAVGLAALRHGDRVTVGVSGDADVVPDPEALVEELDGAVRELVAAVDAPAAAPRAAPGPRAAPDREPAGVPAPSPGRDETHVDTPTELVAEVADPGAEEGAGPQVRVDEPWDGYRSMTAAQVVERLERASDEEAAVVVMYERLHRNRVTVVRAGERALAGR